MSNLKEEKRKVKVQLKIFRLSPLTQNPTQTKVMINLKVVPLAPVQAPLLVQVLPLVQILLIIQKNRKIKSKLNKKSNLKISLYSSL